MRKRTISYVLDKIMWTVIYMFPLFVVLFGSVVTPMPDVLETINNSAFITDFANTTVYTSLNGLFGTGGLVPMFVGETGTAVISYMTYFVNCLIIHLAVDFIAFIPRFAHKCFDKLFGGKDEK